MKMDDALRRIDRAPTSQTDQDIGLARAVDPGGLHDDLYRGVGADAREDVRHGGPEQRPEPSANSVTLDARTRDDEGPLRAEPREEFGQLRQSPGTVDQLG